ncbi:far upstream element-binding protein 2-like [Oppia nitens]|uniref:far upstream element-binding protein 2-like n=1 Tax=Oppia nitens TaxID=1686743 RepID=UPI0023DCAA75|nr:far upstream element-binding protein 2-like [Oppia nitens]
MDSNGSAISNQAFQEALQRARQLAAKISRESNPNPTSSSTSSSSSDNNNTSFSGKRSLDDDYCNEPKRPASFNDPIGAQLAAIKNSTNKPNKNQKYFDGIVMNGEKTLDMMIPGNKVGYVIGKGGEMIRNLQERANVRMTVFQETNEPTEVDKQLRIVGLPDKVDYAQHLVNDLLTEKEIETVRLKTSNPFSKNPTNDYGSQRYSNVEVPVPPQYIGLVIGKGGETIRRIQQECGCKVQFDTTKVDPNGNKICQINGNPDPVKKAVDMVNEIVENAMQGRGPSKHRDGDEVRFTIPAHRTGAVIGRGGDTIKQLKQQSGCDIELEKVSRNVSPEEKVFIIRGPPDKIEYAQALIMDKVNGTSNATPSSYSDSPSNQWPQYWQQSEQQQQQQTQNEDKGQEANYAAWAAYYAQCYAQSQQTTPQAPAATATSNYSMPTNGSAADQAAAAAAGQQPGDPSQSGNQEAIYRQWAEYYRAYGMVKEAEQMEQMLAQYKAQGPKPPSDDHQGADGGDKSSGNANPVAYPGYNYGNYPPNPQQQHNS